MQRYTHSGVIPIGGAILCLVGSAVATAAVAFVYAFIIRWIPWAYLNFLATLGFGMWIGFCVAVLCKMGKIRSNFFVLFAWLVTFAVAYYAYWAASYWAHNGFGMGLRVLDPMVLAAFAEELFDKGSFGLFGANIDGWVLVAFWVVEIGCLLWFSYSIAVAEMNQPFCETCNEWTETEKGVAMYNSFGSEPEWDHLKQGDYSVLTRIPMLAASLPHYVRVDVEHCPKCGNSNFMNIYKVAVTKDDDGDESTEEEKILSNVILSHEQLTFVRELVDRAADEAAAKALVEPEKPLTLDDLPPLR